MGNFIMRALRKYYLKQNALERISPNDWIKKDQIEYDEDTGDLTITMHPHIVVASIADTGSMDGLMDYGHHVILSDFFDINKLAAGDIIAYQYYTKLILHRIVEVHRDDVGRWFITRGDNNIDSDPPIRASQIKYVCKGILY